jgi:hypothetical protein
MSREVHRPGAAPHRHLPPIIAAPLLAAVLVATGTSLTPSLSVATAHTQAGTADCVTIGIPKPTLRYTYRHTESTGQTSQYAQQWDAVTPTGSRVRVTGPRGTEIQENEHHVQDDVVVLDRTTKRTPTGVVVEATAFKPGLVQDPGFRACVGRSWPIPSVAARYQSRQNTASASTPAGTLRILAIRERVTVPAGTFESVRYVRTSQSRDEYWKSVEHGVIVRHVATLPVGVVTEELVSIQ